MLRELHWTGIVFGAATGLIASYILFVFSGELGSNVIAQLIIQLIGFGVAGYVAGRFSLAYVVTAGRVAALLLFFVIAASTIAAGAGSGTSLLPQLGGLILLGVLAIFGGGFGAALADKLRAI